VVVCVVVWNVANQARAFDALASLEPDIALLNEALPPPAATGIWRDETLGRDSKRRPWSAAVLSSHPAAEITDARPQWRSSKRNVPFACSRPGSWIAATVEIEPADSITAVALYGLLDELSDASIHRSLSEISPLIDDRRYGRHVLIGGDLNTGTQWPAGDAFMVRDSNVLQRFEALGLIDCLAATRPPGRLEGCPCSLGDSCTHTRTRLDPRRPHVPYQVDYLWASRALAARLVSCQALATDEWFAISDHTPIVADFDLAGTGPRRCP
jgi:endonuclease/exonuclease/phosphatase family metal-dependent hydrolase